MEKQNLGIVGANILLPAENIEAETWACVACDQYTSQLDYWQAVEEKVGEKPSTLRLMLPECYLSESEQRVPVIHKTMKEYVEKGLLQTAVKDGFVLVERTTEHGARLGLVAAVDLESYSYEKGTKSLIRPTEQTIAARLPARLVIRRGAPMELTHILLLVDDPARTIIEPMYAKKESLRKLYDTDLMGNGGHLRGWAVDTEEGKAEVFAAVAALKEKMGADPLLFAVGDGNHSLATAKARWEELKKELPTEQLADHPARYALVEVENIHCEALLFEPIHRTLMGISAEELLADWQNYAEARGMKFGASGEKTHTMTVSAKGVDTPVIIGNPEGTIPCETAQVYLDDLLARRKDVTIDYIHGDDVARELAKAEKVTAVLLPDVSKETFFADIMEMGVLPRKTFSMGEAHEKRYYMECRTIE